MYTSWIHSSYNRQDFLNKTKGSTLLAVSPCICLFSALYFPSMGGVENYTQHLAHALKQAGFRVIVVTLNTHAGENLACEHDIEIVRLPCRGLLDNRYPIAKKDADYQRLWTWLQDQPIDYVVVNTRFYLHSYDGLSFARKKGITPLLIEHGSAHLTMGNPLIDTGVQLVEHAVTKAQRRFNASYYAVSRKASVWLSHFDITSCGELSNSIDADDYPTKASTRNFRHELNLPSDTFVVAFVGRLVSEKGVIELAEAVENWSLEQEIVILAAGDGPLRETLAAQQNERFHLLGKLHQADVAALLMQADALCLPSRSEGFATTLLEAAACRTPLITTDVGGVDELIPSGEYGTILPSRDTACIREALQKAALDRSRIKETGCCVGKRVRDLYSWDKTAERVIEACKRAQT